MKVLRADQVKTKQIVQSLALLLMLLPAVGLCFSVEAEAEGVTWLMMGLILIGNVLAVWIS